MVELRNNWNLGSMLPQPVHTRDELEFVPSWVDESPFISAGIECLRCGQAFSFIIIIAGKSGYFSNNTVEASQENHLSKPLLSDAKKKNCFPLFMEPITLHLLPLPWIDNIFCFLFFSLTRLQWHAWKMKPFICGIKKLFFFFSQVKILILGWRKWKVVGFQKAPVAFCNRYVNKRQKMQIHSLKYLGPKDHAAIRALVG